MPRECRACPFFEWTTYMNAAGAETGAYCFHPKLYRASRVEGRMTSRILGPDVPDWCPKEKPMAERPMTRIELPPGRHTMYCGGPFETVDFSVSGFGGTLELKGDCADGTKLPVGKLYVEIFSVQGEGKDAD